MTLINPLIDNFYTQGGEDTRLSIGLGPLEFERNKTLISRFLKTSCSIADIGGGTGHYSKWLAELGHRVTLIDPVKKHITQAEQRAKKLKKPFQCVTGEARKLPLAENSQDIVILHGPLYHLRQETDRLTALREAKRVAKKDGIVLGFAITHSASAVAALQSGLLHHDEIFAMCQKELSSGTHQPPESFAGMLPEAFYHRPSKLISEFEAAGFTPADLFAVEGMAWMDRSFFVSWTDYKKRKRLLELLELTERDRELLCFSPHIMLSAHPGPAGD